MAFSIGLALKVAIALLMMDSIIELSFISSMVVWLHGRAGRDFQVLFRGGAFSLHGKPYRLLVDQGHTSNGAAGTAFVLVGLGGILALFLKRRDGPVGARSNGFGTFWYRFWLVMTVLSMLLTLSALIFTFVITNDHAGQTINASFASALDNWPFPDYIAYSDDKWTPENWFTAVLELNLASASDRRDIENHLRIMKGWRYNLIPMFFIGLAVAALAFIDFFKERRTPRPQAEIITFDKIESPLPLIRRDGTALDGFRYMNEFH